jgi:hypothetical protein
MLAWPPDSPTTFPDAADAARYAEAGPLDLHDLVSDFEPF